MASTTINDSGVTFPDGTVQSTVAMAAKTAVTTSSGTSSDFTSFPSGVKRITFMMDSVTLSGTSQPRIRLGYGGGTIASSGYTGVTAANITGTSTTSLSGGFDVQSLYSNTSNVFYGSYVLTNITGNLWLCSAQYSVLVGATGVGAIIGSVALGGALDRVRFTTVSGTDTFASGTINVLYE